MARILIATTPLTGHTMPALGLAQKLVERGHEVYWYGGKAFQRQIEKTGAIFKPVTSRIDWSEIDVLEWAKANIPNAEKLEGLAQLKVALKQGFIDRATEYLQDLQQILTSFKADVLLSDSFFLTGKLLHEKTGLSWATFGESCLTIASRDTAPFGLGIAPGGVFSSRLVNQGLQWLVSRVLMRDVNQHYNSIRVKNGLPATSRTFFDDLVSPFLIMQGTVAEFEYPRSDLPHQLHFVGPLLPLPPANFTEPQWWPELVSSQKPVVLVTQGTVNNNSSDLLLPTLQALANENVLVIATTGGVAPEKLPLGTIPANARIESFVPYAQLMPHLSAMVTNGGYGSVQLALAHGLPLVAAGTTEDKPEVAARIAWAGVGVNLKTKSPAPEQIQQAVAKVLNEPGYRQQAQQIQASISQHDTNQEAADLLEKLITTREPVSSLSQE